MKTTGKSLIYVSLGLLALTGLSSCADDEPIAERKSAGEAISFRPGMSGQTRATEITNDNLQSIYVSALMGGKSYFSDVEYSKGSDSFFTSAHEYVWPGDTTKINFYAYAPSQDEIGADILPDEKQIPELQSFAVPEEIKDQVDFITANAVGDRKSNEENGVELTFSHRLAQIEIRALTNNTDYVYKVAGARIGRVEYLGNFNFGTNEWTLDDWHDTAIYDTSIAEATLGSTSVSLMGEGGNAMLMPQTLTGWDVTGDPDNVARGSYISVLINITTKDGIQMYPFPSDTKLDSKTGKVREYAWASIPLTGKWEQGKKYVYTLDFTNGAGNVDPDDPNPGYPVLGKGIKFSVNVLDWTDAESSIPMTTIYK